MSLESELAALSIQITGLANAVKANTAAVLPKVEPVPAPEPIPVPPPPPTTYPVLCADPARDYAWWADGPNKVKAFDFLAPRIGLTEKHARQYMPSSYKGLTWAYALDLSVMLVDDDDFRDAENCPNEWFLLDPSGSRYTQYIWNTHRWFWDFSKPEVRAHVIERLKVKAAGSDVLFLDEHAMIIGQPTTQVVRFLHELRAALPATTYIMPNTSQNSIHPGYREQALAAGSVDFEIQWASGAMRGWDLKHWAAFAKEITDKGGLVLLTGSIGTNGVHGDYNRELMWRLAAYWMIKAPGVYLDLMSHPANGNDLSHREWAKALEFDLGQPLGPMVGVDMGNGAIVFKREFEKAWVYVRGQDSWETTDFGDASAVMITPPVPAYRLLPGGLQEAKTVTLGLRTADSAILIKP